MMIGDLMHKGALRLPDLGGIVRPISSVAGLIRGSRQQVLLGSVAAIAVAALGVTAVGYVRHTRSVVEAQLAASRVETANVDLQDQLAHLRDQIVASNRDLASAQKRVAALTEEMHAHPQPQTAPAEPTTAPAAAKGDKAAAQMAQQLHAAEAQRATLAARLSKAEADLAEQQAKQNELLGQIDQWQKRLEQVSSDRDRLKARVGELERQSALKHAQQPVAAALPEAQQRVAGVLNAPAPAAAPVQQPAAAAAATPVAVARAAVAVATAPVVVARGAVDQFSRVLASAGVDVRHLFSEYGVNRGEGGPVVPLARGQAIPNAALTPEKLAALRAMVKALPVSAPLDSYEISSPFGPRGDPEDGRGEFHTGVDLRAPYDTPVYATAPGVVTFASYRDDYGKIVEIDHGNGITTRYAHLHAFTVSVGQHVGLHQQIGYLGSTGRATGPHTHYEVVVNGEPQDPLKFIGLGRYVPSMTVPVSARD